MRAALDHPARDVLVVLPLRVALHG
jgi:hypothetical protein